MSSGLTGDMPIATVEEGSAAFRIRVPSSDDHIGKYLLQCGAFYEAELLRALKRVIRPGDTVVDVGANIGNHTVFFAGVLKCKVIAVEPVPLLAEILRSNVSRNKLSDLVSVHQVALGYEEALAEIAQFDENNYGGTSLSLRVDGDIEVKPLDALVSDTVGLIKIDAEGMDYQVLLGAREVLERDMPVVVIEAMTPDAVAQIESFLTPLGYSIFGEYNATPTYVFFPTRSSQQLRRAVAFLGLTVAEQIVTQRSQESTIRQVSRYAERLSTETYNRIMAKLDDQRPAPSAQSRQVSSDSVTSAVLQLRLDSLASTLEIERKAFIELSEQYKVVTSRAERLEGDINARSRRLKGWQDLEVAAKFREQEGLETEFQALTGRPLQEAASIVQQLRTENSRLSASLRMIEDENADKEDEVRKLMVSRGEYGRENRKLKLQLAEMTAKVEGLQPDHTKLQSNTSRAPSRRVPGAHRIHGILRKIKTKIATTGK
ncbi:FkbM family methyltransferase [Arthrobacter sp. YD2]|uniref:FkbM family methyltransferase n=1 Tax=Arthrobacter sp. YD2 TaxID=3058046 RepID=UPI0025B399D6|nr:FkbM family methyltransferase [Arthrobacter sp. YD2]MDN3904178.1 FkbM family methyltransferase [Arthrobacter sp. YD2]